MYFILDFFSFPQCFCVSSAMKTHFNNLFSASSLFILTCLCFLRARLRPLPNGGKHLRRLRRGWLPGGRLLLHLSAAQAADPAAHSLLPAQLPGWNHPHDPHHRSPESPRSVATVQHGHHQLQLSRRGQLHAEVLLRRSGAAAAAAARLPGVCYSLLVSLHPHPSPSDSASTSTSTLHISTSTHVRRHPTPLHPCPASAPPAFNALSPLSERRVPPSTAVLLPSTARCLHSS